MNKLATSGGDNPYLIQRHLEAATSSLQPSDKLFEFQEFLARKNKLALDLSCSKIEGIKRSTTKSMASISAPSIDPAVNVASSANAAAHTHGQLGRQDLKTILSLFQKRPYEVGLVLTILQIYVLTGKNVAAIKILEEFFKRLDAVTFADYQDVRFHPGLIAIAISLYSSQGRKLNAGDELARAASYWKTREKAPSGLLKAAGISLLEGSEPDDLKTAEEIFLLLNKQNPNDRFAQIGLTVSSSPTSSSSQPSKTTSLTPLDQLLTGIDVATLENAGIPKSDQLTAAILKRKQADDSSTKPNKKRLRKSKLPKDFDPNKKPDPERWIPLRDRSTYRPKGRKGKQKQSTATQGSSEKVPDNAPAQEKTTVATASSGVGKAKKKKVKK